MTGLRRPAADEHYVRLTPPAVAYDAESYQADAHRAGMVETMALLHQERPGAALRRIARTVTEELACLGYPGVTVHVGDGMARLIAAKRLRRAVAS